MGALVPREVVARTAGARINIRPWGSQYRDCSSPLPRVNVNLEDWTVLIFLQALHALDVQ